MVMNRTIQIRLKRDCAVQPEQESERSALV